MGVKTILTELRNRGDSLYKFIVQENADGTISAGVSNKYGTAALVSPGGTNFSSTTELEAAYPAATHPGARAMVGAAEYKSNGVAWQDHSTEHAAMGLGSNRGRFVFIGDSLTFASAFRAPGLFDGRPWWSSTPTLTNLGGGNWIIAAQVDGRAPSGAAGTLQTDGAGRVQWAYTGDTYGPYVDCSAGGWYMLQSGSSTYGCFITVRGATTPPASAGTGAVTTAGIPQIGDYNLIGFPAWTAGALGDTFEDYQPWGITGATSADLLKHVSQAFVYPADAACLLIGTNDAPATAGSANVTIANIKAAIDYASTKVRVLYVGDIFPSTAASATVQKYLSLISATIREYCKTKINCRFWSAYDYLASPTALAITQKTGAFHTDQLHLMPYGGYLASLDLVRLIQQDFPTNRTRKSGLDVFDATVGTGAWNANHTLRGTGGTVTASHGVTGTCPDSWTITRSTSTGGSQVCTTSFDTASDGGLSWWSMAVSGAAAGEYHELSQIVSVPSGITAGDYFRVLAELNVDSTTSPGVAVLAIQANGNGNLNAAYLVQTSRNISTFSTEKPALQLQSEPQILISGTTSFTLRIRVGAAASGGVGKIGFRNFRIEKCSGPIYP